MNKLTEFGFVFGAMEVTRACTFPDGACVIIVKAKKKEISIIVSRGGRSLRVVDSGTGKEWKAPK